MSKENITVKDQEHGMLCKFMEVDLREILFATKTEGSLFWNARQDLGQKEMEKFRESIKNDGLLEEPVFRDLNGKQQVVCGERRCRSILYLLEHNEPCHNLATGRVEPAEKVYGTIRVKVLFNCTDLLASRYSIAENLERKNLSEWELMEYCRELIALRKPNGDPAYERKDIAFIIHRSATWISQTMSLYNLPPRTREMLSDGALQRTVALKLLQVSPKRVEAVLNLAQKLAEEEVEENRTLAAERVKSLEEAFLNAEIECSATELLGDKADTSIRRSARSVRSDIDRRLSDARNRETTAANREARLNTDSVARATDQIPGARRGKSNGMPPKAVRSALRSLQKQIDEDPKSLVCPATNQKLVLREAKIVVQVFRMVLGDILERDPLLVLSMFNADEGKKGWKSPIVPTEAS